MSDYKYVGVVIIHDTPWGFPVMYPHDAKPSQEELLRAVIDYFKRPTATATSNAALMGGGTDHGR